MILFPERFCMPTVNLVSPGAVKMVGDRCSVLGGKKALIVTDKAMEETGIAGKVIENINEAGLETAVFNKVEPNPKDKNVEEGLTIYREEKCDMIVTVGGGTAHDCGKGIGIVATHPQGIRDYAGLDTLTNPLPPLVCVNTTAGTASEITRHCVITNTDTKVKFVICDWRNTPQVSINDPELHVSMPPGLTAATGMDALTHAVETYVSLAAFPLTDACALYSIELISKNLRQAVANGENLEARENMVNAQLLAGMAFNNGGLGYVHAMAHQLGGMYDMPHGVANAILLPHVERFNLISNLDRFARMAVVMGENIEGLSPRNAAEKCIDAIEQLSRDVGIPSSISELGIKDPDFESMARAALLDGNAGTNPIKGTEKDIVSIFEKVV